MSREASTMAPGGCSPLAVLHQAHVNHSHNNKFRGNHYGMRDLASSFAHVGRCPVSRLVYLCAFVMCQVQSSPCHSSTREYTHTIFHTFASSILFRLLLSLVVPLSTDAYVGLTLVQSSESTGPHCSRHCFLVGFLASHSSRRFFSLGLRSIETCLTEQYSTVIGCRNHPGAIVISVLVRRSIHLRFLFKDRK